MNLQTHIRNNLWLAVQSTYQAGNYSHAILDAMHYLSTVLRDKTGVDGDGVTLVGQALGGDSPRLRVNRLQTDTERNEQRGIESILRGMYQAIRNPRSHEQIEDAQDTADVIICFVSYLLGIIERSEEPFVMSKFMKRVFDPDFYRSRDYAQLLVDGIPTHKRFDTLVAIYREKLNGDIYDIGLVVDALIGKLPDDQVNQYLQIVSDELSVISDEKEFRYNLHLLPPRLWEQLAEVSRLRVENKVIRAIREGEVVGDKCRLGGLATWARNHFGYFNLRDQVGWALLEKLESRSPAGKRYVVSMFLQQLPHVMPNRYCAQRSIKAISDSIRQKDDEVLSALLGGIGSLPDDWQALFVGSLKDLTDEESPALWLPDGTPFLASDQFDGEAEDLPF